MRRIFYSYAGLALLACALLLFNALTGSLLKNAQLDLTENRLYSLSDGTRQLLAELEEPVELQLFFSSRAARDLPQVRQYARRVQELLERYVTLAGGRLTLELIDPEPFSPQEDEAALLGLQSVPLPMGDSLYLGLAGRNAQGRQAAIPLFALDQEAFLEYELSRLVYSLSRSRQPVVGLLSGLPLEGGFDPAAGQQPPWLVLDQVRQQFALEFLDTGVDEIPPQVDVLWLVHPHTLSQPTLYAIDQFVLRGGRLLAFIDPLSERDTLHELQQALGEGRDSGMPQLLRAWGVELQAGRVLADAGYAMTVSAGEQQRPVRHLAWLDVPAAGLNREDVVSARLERLTLASAGILQPLDAATTRFVPLVQSSELAMPLAAARLNSLTHPGELFAGMEPTGEQYALAARISGPAHSAFADGLEGQLPGLTQAADIQVILVADTDLLADAMWAQVQEFGGQRMPLAWADNASLLLNALDNLSGSQALIGVRTSGQFSRPFELVERIRSGAAERFRDTEQQLQLRLARVEQQIEEVQQTPEAGEKKREQEQLLLQQYRMEQLDVRKALREVRYQQNADIEALGRAVKLFNLLLMPVLLSVGWVLFGLHRRSLRD
ncbi:MAG: Gldg family protein [Thiopseudomonas sp.]|nr:Gldg family protein [Thiopseudomonas sp.]